MNLARIVIGAPFGNYFSFPGATSTVGTYTWHYRGGALYRLWRCFRTLRYRRGVGWVNRLGLPNPGLHALRPGAASGAILSIHGFDAREWECLAEVAVTHAPLAVELNLGCPNVGYRPSVAEVLPAVRALLAAGLPVVAKLPPLRWLDYARPLYDAGVTGFHCCNTIPTPSGGLSGKALKPYSLWAVEELRARFWGRAYLIGGGGVTCAQDAHDYFAAGADSVAVASALLNPLRWRGIRRLALSLAPAPQAPP